MGPVPLGGSYERGRFPQPGNHFHWLGDQLGQIRSFTGSEESAATRLWEAEQRETSTDGPGHLAALPRPRCTSASACRG